MDTDTVSGVPGAALRDSGPLEPVLAFLIHLHVAETLYHPAGGPGLVPRSP